MIYLICSLSTLAIIIIYYNMDKEREREEKEIRKKFEDKDNV